MRKGRAIVWDKKAWRLVALIGVTVLPPAVIVFTTQRITGLTVLQAIVALTSAIVLWFQFCLQYSEQVRRVWIKLRSSALNPDVSLSLSARFAAPADASVDEVVQVIRRYYARTPELVRTATLAETGETYMEMPHWQARFKLHVALDQEYDVGHSDFGGSLYVTIPDTQRGMRTALALVKHDVNLLFQKFVDTLGVKLEAISVTLRFVDGDNPYLPAYVTNVKSSAIRKFECTVDDSCDAHLTIREESVTVAATNSAAFMSALLRHLSL